MWFLWPFPSSSYGPVKVEKREFEEWQKLPRVVSKFTKGTQKDLKVTSKGLWKLKFVAIYKCVEGRPWRELYLFSREKFQAVFSGSYIPMTPLWITKAHSRSHHSTKLMGKKWNLSSLKLSEKLGSFKFS